MVNLLADSRNRVKSLADQIYDRLRHDIIIGQLQPGDRLVELEVAQMMGTSQGPVREAFQRLERDGLVSKQARSATTVTTATRDEILELFTIRSDIEKFAVRRIAPRIKEEQIAQLNSLMEQMVQAGQAGDMFALTESDMRFHRQLCIWSGNTALHRAWDPLYSQIQRFVVQTHQGYFDSLIDLANTHNPIIEALQERDADKAAQIIEEHVMLIWSRIEQSENQI